MATVYKSNSTIFYPLCSSILSYSGPIASLIATVGSHEISSQDDSKKLPLFILATIYPRFSSQKDVIKINGYMLSLISQRRWVARGRPDSYPYQ